MRTLVTRLATAVVGLAGLVAALTVGAPAALAGSNGQQLLIHDGPTALSVGIRGTNQYANYQIHYVNTPGPWTYVPGWWWKYTIRLNSFSQYNGRGVFIGYRRPYVPVDANLTYFTVYAY